MALVFRCGHIEISIPFSHFIYIYIYIYICTLHIVMLYKKGLVHYFRFFFNYLVLMYSGSRPFQWVLA